MDVPAIIDGKAPTSPAAWLANVSAHGERDGDQARRRFPVRAGPGVALAIRGETRPEEPDGGHKKRRAAMRAETRARTRHALPGLTRPGRRATVST